ncbi:MAG: hypothetical protein WD768_14925 [Phycisphaeraceae bacterium]
MPESSRDEPPFLAEVIGHRRLFAQAVGLPESAIHVRLYLADGTTLNSINLPESPALGPHRWGLLIGIKGRNPAQTVVIRESQVIKAEFEAAAPRPQPIGFLSEAQG